MSTIKFEVSDDTVRFWGGDEDVATQPCVLLLLLLLASVTLNAVIVIGVFRSFLRSHVFNLLLASICLSLFLDAGVNLVLATLIRSSWVDLYRELGNGALMVFCELNAASSQIPLLLQSFQLMLLSAHRSSVLGLPGKQLRQSAQKPAGFKFIKRLCIVSWAEAFLLMLPLVFGVIDCRYFQQRYSCCPADVTADIASMGVAIVILVVGYILPWSITLQYWAVLLLRVMRERQRLQTLELVALQRAAARSSPLRGLGSPLGFSVPPWSQIWGPGDTSAGEGFRFFMLCGLLVASFTLLVIPHIICIQVFQFYTSYTPIHDHKPLFGNATHLPNSLKPIWTPSYDGTFAWFRFLNPLIMPIFIISFHSGIRNQVFALFICCKGRRSLRSTSNFDSMTGYLVNTKKNQRKSKYKQLLNGKTPVLFATEEGICLRQVVADFPSNAPTKLPFTCQLVDHFCKKSNGSVPRLILSPEVCRRSVQSLMELEEVDQRKKCGKVVRFSQRVSEIPLGDSGVSSDGTSEGGITVVRPALELSTANLMRQMSNRRSSIPYTRFPAQRDETRGTQGRSLEMEMANSLGSSLNLSSSSLLLSLSQRMRNRDS